VFRNPGLADTLEQITLEGRDAFYRGAIARRIDAFMRDADGYLRYEDMSEHRSEWVEPVSISYRGYEVWELPPNGQGIAALQMLQILQGYDIRRMGFGSAEYLHLFVEAKKLAFEDRARFYADPEFYQAPVARLISPEYAAQRRNLIDTQKAAKMVPPGNPAIDAGDTVYLTTADGQRNMVSLIQSNYGGFGSGLCPPGLGFCLQNRGELFDLRPERPNSYAPGKRPFHTIIPAFVTKEGMPIMSFGVMGGDMQPQGHVQILVNLIDFEMGLQEAGDAPRLRHVGSTAPTGQEADAEGREVQVEAGFAPETVRALVQQGHKVTAADGAFGGYQAIWYDRERGVYIGASESRKDGMALGY
jgi:gamma-glutamyltranspeptidase/glutathione hydrolase